MLKLQYFGHLMQRADSLEKSLILGKIEGKRRRGQQRMRWHHQLNEFGQTLGNSEGHGGLACCHPRGRKELDVTEQLSNNCLKGLLPFGRALGPHPFSTVAFRNGAWLLTIQAEVLFLVPLQESGGWLGDGKGAIVLLSGISESVKNFKQGRSVEVVTFLAWSPAGLTLNAVYPPYFSKAHWILQSPWASPPVPGPQGELRTWHMNPG